MLGEFREKILNDQTEKKKTIIFCRKNQKTFRRKPCVMSWATSHDEHAFVTITFFDKNFSVKKLDNVRNCRTAESVT